MAKLSRPYSIREAKARHKYLPGRSLFRHNLFPSILMFLFTSASIINPGLRALCPLQLHSADSSKTPVQAKWIRIFNPLVLRHALQGYKHANSSYTHSSCRVASPDVCMYGCKLARPHRPPLCAKRSLVVQTSSVHGSHDEKPYRSCSMLKAVVPRFRRTRHRSLKNPVLRTYM